MPQPSHGISLSSHHDCSCLAIQCPCTVARCVPPGVTHQSGSCRCPHYQQMGWCLQPPPPSPGPHEPGPDHHPGRSRHPCSSRHTTAATTRLTSFPTKGLLIPVTTQQQQHHFNENRPSRSAARQSSHPCAARTPTGLHHTRDTMRKRTVDNPEAEPQHPTHPWNDPCYLQIQCEQ